MAKAKGKGKKNPRRAKRVGRQLADIYGQATGRQPGRRRDRAFRLPGRAGRVGSIAGLEVGT